VAELSDARAAITRLRAAEASSTSEAATERETSAAAIAAAERRAEQLTNQVASLTASIEVDQSASAKREGEAKAQMDALRGELTTVVGLHMLH
jgi:hypothetical protein